MSMPIKQPHNQQHGFTILELLVVLLIIGVIVSMATLSIGTSQDKDKLVRNEAQRLVALLELAQQESVLNMREMVLQIDEESYQFLVYDGQDLVPAESDLFRPRELPTGILISAEVEGQAAEQDLFGETEASQVWILSSGELSSFSITLEMEDGPSYQLNGDMMGNLELEEPLES